MEIVVTENMLAHFAEWGIQHKLDVLKYPVKFMEATCTEELNEIVLIFSNKQQFKLTIQEIGRYEPLELNGRNKLSIFVEGGYYKEKMFDDDDEEGCEVEPEDEEW